MAGAVRAGRTARSRDLTAIPQSAPIGYAERARVAHAAMCARFERGDGTLARDGRLRRRGAPAHLWPFARAFVATLDVLGIDGGDDRLHATVDARLRALEAYWDDRGPAYASDHPRRGRLGGDIYYDDNAWAGLALVQCERLRPDAGRLDRAAQLAAFARGGWDENPSAPSPGGIFWVQQGRGLGARNHDRNAISTAPNAQLHLHLRALGACGEPAGFAQRCADWVQAALARADGLIRDKLRGNGTIDAATWSYNQGSMIGLRAQLGQIEAARALCTRSLDHYTQSGWAGEPWEFIAIFMRNALRLHETADADLRARIAAALRERADAAWASVRADRDASLLALAALVSLQALAAWDPDGYPRLA